MSPAQVFKMDSSWTWVYRTRVGGSVLHFFVIELVILYQEPLNSMFCMNQCSWIGNNASPKDVSPSRMRQLVLLLVLSIILRNVKMKGPNKSFLNRNRTSENTKRTGNCYLRWGYSQDLKIKVLDDNFWAVLIAENIFLVFSLTIGVYFNVIK